MTTTGPTGYDIIALGFAGLGVILGAASLGWNYAQFKLSGPRVKANLMFGALGNGGIASSRGPKQPNWSDLAAQGFTEPLVGVEVVNAGRTPTEVQHFSCELSGGFGYFKPGLPYNPQPETLLTPFTPRTWWVPLEDILRLAATIRRTGQVPEPLVGAMAVQVAGPETFRTESFTL